MKTPRLLCNRIQDMPGVPQVHSFVDSCEHCGKAVWRAESSNKKAIAICSHCVAPDLRSGDAKIKPLSKEQIADLKARAARLPPPHSDDED